MYSENNSTFATPFLVSALHLHACGKCFLYVRPAKCRIKPLVKGMDTLVPLLWICNIIIRIRIWRSRDAVAKTLTFICVTLVNCQAVQKIAAFQRYMTWYYCCRLLKVTMVDALHGRARSPHEHLLSKLHHAENGILYYCMKAKWSKKDVRSEGVNISINSIQFDSIYLLSKTCAQSILQITDN